jgi:hypothetical protein
VVASSLLMVGAGFWGGFAGLGHVGMGDFWSARG